MKPLTKADLAEQKCENPECADPECSSLIALLSICHPLAGALPIYDKRTGVLNLKCRVCGDDFGAVLVAERPPLDS